LAIENDRKDAQMVICPECGTYVKERSMFCYNCGRPVKDDWVHVDDEIEEETFGIALSDLDEYSQTGGKKQIEDDGIKLRKAIELVIKDPAIPEDAKIGAIIHMTALLCAIIAVQPLPFADVIVLTPIQVGMVTAMSRVMGDPVGDSGAKEIIAHVLGVVGWGVLAQHAILGLYKAGLPYIAGVTTIPLVYAATVGLGYAAKAVLEARRNDQTITQDEIKRIRKEAEAKARKEKRDWSIQSMKEEFKKQILEAEAYQKYLDVLHKNQVDGLNAKIAELTKGKEEYEQFAEELLSDLEKVEEKLKSSVGEEDYYELYSEKSEIELKLQESDRKLKQVEQEKAELEKDRERRIATRREKIEKRFAYLYPSVKVSHHRVYKTMAGMSDDDVIAIEKQISELHHDAEKANWRNQIQGTKVREIGCRDDLRLYVSFADSGYVIEEVGTKSTQDKDIRRLKDRCSV